MNPVARLASAALLGLAAIGVPLGAETQPSAGAAIVARLLPPMKADARFIAEEKWREPLDRVVQRSAAAESLGSRWTRDLPAWKTARAAVGKRFTRLVDAYMKIDELPQLLRTTVAASFPGPTADALKAALDGPAGGSIIRQQALIEFVTGVMSLDPNGPQPGQPEWMKQLSALGKQFDTGIGPDMPAGDRAQDDAVTEFSKGPLGMPFRMLWMTVLGKADVTIDGATNLMIFDDRNAILKDIAAAVATVK